MKVNYKSDFELTIQLTAGGVDVAAPSWDWQLRFYTFDRQAVYTVAHIDGKAERCAVNTDGTITAYFDKHGLMPGVLRCEFVNLVPDSHYTHDTQMQVDPVELGVELWRGASDGGMDAVTLELAGQVLAEVQALAADLQQKAESGYFDGEPGPQGPPGPPGPAGPGLLVVTVTGSDQEALTADHTAAEILAAHDAGRPVVAVYGGEVYQLASVGASLASFSLASADLDVLAQIDVDGDGGAVRIFEGVQGVLTAGEGITIDGVEISAPRAVPFVVTLTPSGTRNQFTPDCTFADAVAADKAGRRVLFKLNEEGTAMSVDAHIFYLGDNALGIFATYILEPQLTTFFWSYDEAAVARAVTSLQPALTFDNTPTAGSNNPVKSGGVFTALQSKADTTVLQNFCPIIEDTRSSAVANITGVAPFSTLQDGQRIVLHFAYKSVASSTLTLTLSGGDTTATIPIYKNSYNNVSQLGSNGLREDTFYTLIYYATANRWWIVGCVDTNTAYATMSQGEINAGSSTDTRVVTTKLLCDNFDKVTTLVEVTSTGDVTQALDSGKFYRFGEVDSLTLTFTAPSAGMGMWGGKFTASANWSALGIPATIDEAAGNDTIAGGKTYEFNVLDNIIVVKEV